MLRSERALDLDFEKQERGVYIARRKINGHRLCYSVTAAGEELCLKTVPPDGDLTAAIAWLWADLRKYDPVPLDLTTVTFSDLRLVKDPGPGRHPRVLRRRSLLQPDP